MQIDSVLDSNYRYLSKNIVQRYDTPTLMAERKAIIDALSKQNRLSFSGIIILCILLAMTFIFAYYYYQKQKKLKMRFNEIMNNYDNLSRLKPALREKEDTNNKDVGISKDIVETILNGISGFVEKQSYLDPEINLHILAKKLQTNPKYLSKIINFYEQKSFTSYINELRINYAIAKLKADKMFCRYAIKAIAYEVGFNNQQSFSQAFYKKTGMLPSYFIKQLQKQADN